MSTGWTIFFIALFIFLFLCLIDILKNVFEFFQEIFEEIGWKIEEIKEKIRAKKSGSSSSKSTSYQSYSYSYSSSLAAKEEEARRHMYAVSELYTEALNDLRALEEMRDTMNPTEYEQKYRSLECIVLERKKNLALASEAFRQAANETP